MVAVILLSDFCVKKNIKEQCEEEGNNEKRKRKRYSSTMLVDVSNSLWNGVKCLSLSPLVTVCRLPTEDHPDGRFLVAVERHSTFPPAGSQPCHTVHGLWSPEALLPANIPHSGQFHCSSKDRMQLLLIYCICAQNEGCSCYWFAVFAKLRQDAVVTDLLYLFATLRMQLYLFAKQTGCSCYWFAVFVHKTKTEAETKLWMKWHCKLVHG